jgi:hypothetical protein
LRKNGRNQLDRDFWLPNGSPDASDEAFKGVKSQLLPQLVVQANFDASKTLRKATIYGGPVNSHYGVNPIVGSHLYCWNALELMVHAEYKPLKQ